MSLLERTGIRQRHWIRLQGKCGIIRAIHFRFPTSVNYVGVLDPSFPLGRSGARDERTRKWAVQPLLKQEFVEGNICFCRIRVNSRLVLNVMIDE